MMEREDIRSDAVQIRCALYEETQSLSEAKDRRTKSMRGHRVCRGDLPMAVGDLSRERAGLFLATSEALSSQHSRSGWDTALCRADDEVQQLRRRYANLKRENARLMSFV